MRIRSIFYENRLHATIDLYLINILQAIANDF